MITESFINSCFSLALSKSTVRKDKALYRDIISILEFQEKRDSLDVPVTIQNKFECLKKICDLKLDGRITKNVVDSILEGDKFSTLREFVDTKFSEELNDLAAIDIVKQVRLRIKLNSLFTNHDKLSEFLTSIKDGSFTSIDDVVLDYENIIRELYTTMMDENRGSSIEASASLDLMQDDYESVLELTKQKYERQNTTPTGYTVFDNEVLKGGFESSRIYIFGGASGSGKSTILLNMMLNSAVKLKNVDQLINDIAKPKVEGINNVYVTITMENSIDETLMRLYQCMFKKTDAQYISDIVNGIDIKEKIQEELKKTGSTIVMKYFPAMSVSALDLMTVLDDVIEIYGPGTIKGLYVDYLDLMRTDVKYDMYRLELGHITLSLKSLAVAYNIPIIVPTQLGRSAYRVQSSHELNLDQISESIKKVEHADFVALLSKDPDNDNLVHLKVGKNRSGKSDVALDFSVDFSYFQFINAVKVSNEKKQEPTEKNDKSIDEFSGLMTI